MNTEPTTITTSNQQRPSIRAAISLMGDLSHETSKLSVPNNVRSRLAAGCHFVAAEHHAGIALLCSVGHPASALALLRPAFESYVRGVWISECATDAQIADFQSGKSRSIPAIKAQIEAIEKTPTFDSGILGRSHSENWHTLCGFAHTGIEQLQMCMTRSAIERNCTGEQIDEALAFAGACAIMASIAVATLAGDDQIALRILEFGKAFSRFAP